jgi:DUF1009 family protein
MAEVGARLLAIEAGRTLLLDVPRLWQFAQKSGIAVFGAPVSRAPRAH